MRRSAALIALAALACSGDDAASPASLAITFDGRAERGSTIALHATRSGAEISPASLEWTVVPEAAALITGADEATLLDTGLLTFRATDNASANTAASGSRSLQVVPPPNILFDMHDTITDTVRNGNRNIYRVALDGRDLVRLTSGGGDNIHPTSSADGSAIIFTSFRTNSATLFSVSSSGSSEAPLPGMPATSTDAAFATTGGAFAFVGPLNGSPSLWVSSGEGAAATPVPGSSSAAIVASPAWCMGGDSLVIVTTAFSNAALYLESSTTGQGRLLTNASSFDVEPACSSDGGSIAFASTRDGGVGLYELRSQSGSSVAQRLDTMPANDGQPAWLPEGRIVFVSAVGTDSAHLAWLDPEVGRSATRIPITGGGAPGHPTYFRGSAP
jgi:hypothetical protein